MNRALRGFDSLRTQLPEPVTLPPKPRCLQCGAVLRHGNTGTLCSPCERGEYDVPEWALIMAEYADKNQLNLLARMVRAHMNGETESRYLLKRDRKLLDAKGGEPCENGADMPTDTVDKYWR